MNRLMAATGFLLAVLPVTTTAGAEFRTDIEYANVDGESLKLDASVPEGDGPFPIVILIHGGGWGGGDRSVRHVPPRKPLTDAGFTWFSIDYRLAPKHRWPACIDDVRSAIRWVKEHAAEFKGDPSRIALAGYSAGGHLAAFAAATADDDTETQAVVLLAAPTDLVADCERRGGVSGPLQALFDRPAELNDDARATLRDASPLTRVTADMPPCFLIHGTDDVSVPYEQSVHLKARLEELGVPCELVTIPGGVHDRRQWEPIDPEYQEKMVRWLQSQFKASP